MIDISIIVPVYQEELFLRQCIDSLVNQSLYNIEIICVYGHSESRDRSLEILREYEKKDSRIKVLEKENEGVSFSRNIGLEQAAGKYVMFVDADDWLDVDACRYVHEKAEEKKADIVMFSYIREFASNSSPKKIFKDDELVFADDEVRNKLHRRFIGLLGMELAQVENADALCPVWGKLYRKEILDRKKIVFEDIRKIGTYEDGLFNLYVFYYAKSVIYIQKCFYHYRKDNTNSITSRYKESLFTQWLNLFDIMESYIKENQLSLEYMEALNNRICLSILGQGLNLLESNKNFKEKYNLLKAILKNPRYRQAYKQFSLEYFSIHWKLFYWCGKHQCTIGVYLLLIVIKCMIGR